jgi:hypothetical protein
MGKARFRRLDYDLYEQLEKARIPGSVFQILLVVIDYTIGYRREDAPIPLTRFMDKTYLTRQGVIKAIHDAERRGILRVNRQGTNPKTATIYAVNLDSMGWFTGKMPRASKPQLTSKVVNHSLLDQSTTVDQTSKHPSFATPIESNSKETLKVKQCNKDKLTAISLITKVGGDIEVDGNHVRDTVLEYLHSIIDSDNGNACDPQDIVRQTGIALDTVMATLLSLESQRLAAVYEGKWWACEVQSG